MTHQDPETGFWLLTQTVGFGAAELAMRWAPAPTGPWSTALSVFRPPESDWPNVLVYAGKGHPELAGADLVATYVANSFDFGTLVHDQRLYYPRFVKISVLPP